MGEHRVEAEDRDEVGRLLARCCVGCETCGEGRIREPHPADLATEPFREPGDLTGTGPLSPEVQHAMGAVSRAPLLLGNTVRLLRDGRDSFGAMLDLVRGAEADIRLENFIFRADHVGSAFARELRRRADEGVRVRVLHDPVGSLMTRRRPAIVLFRGSAVAARLFNPPLPSRYSRHLGRDHRKLVVADEASMVVGGICLADPWAGNCVRHCTWRDSALRVDGPAATAAAARFDDAWRLGRRRSRSRTPTAPRTSDGGRAVGSIPVRLVTDLGAHRTTLRMLQLAIDAAQDEIRITNPYFIPPAPLVTSLVNARARGVAVAILVPRRNNHPTAALAGEPRLGRLLDAGVEMFRWRGPMIHAKSVVVDRRWTLVGSSNLDPLSLYRNAELNVEVHGTALGTAMATLFERDIESSSPYTAADWRSRGRLRGFAGRLAGVAAPWL